MNAAVTTRPSELELRRLRARAARLRRAIAALEDPRMFREEPGALREAIAQFRAELGRVERRIAGPSAS